jgi:nucleolar pre-ribosomal-associated protein 2
VLYFFACSVIGANLLLSIQPSRSPQEALLRLEKSSDSPTTLLDHAAQVVGIDLALCASHPEINTVAKTRTTSAPKAEWVLRWLLKKLKQAKQFRAQPASFLLLTQLIGLIQPKALATILSDYDFLRVLNDIFADVEEEAVFAGFEDRFAEEPSPSGSESSLTLGSSPSQDGGSDRKGTKRKRPVESGNGDSMEIDDAVQTSASCLLAFIRLLDCLYSLVVLVTETLGDDEVARARLTQAIRSGPEPGAVMLAKSFRIAAVATSHFSQRRMTTDLQHLMYVIPAALGLWGLRASQEGGSENKASNVCCTGI